MIRLEDILILHEASIRRFGGSMGIRDSAMLESAIARPFQTFGGEELYPDAFSKAAALAESLIINHPFVDGNKRTGFTAMTALLLENNLRLMASQSDAYETMIKVSTGEMNYEHLRDWLKLNCSQQP